MASAAGIAENRCGPPVRVCQCRCRTGQLLLLARGGVPDHEAVATGRRTNPIFRGPVEEYAAMAGVGDPPPAHAAVDAGRGEGGGRDESEDVGAACAQFGVVWFVGVAEEAEQGWGAGAVELAVSAAEPGPGDEAAPRLADEGGLDEARGVVGREPEQDLLLHLLRQLWRRAQRRRRRHGAAECEGMQLVEWLRRRAESDSDCY